MQERGDNRGIGERGAREWQGDKLHLTPLAENGATMAEHTAMDAPICPWHTTQSGRF